MAATTTPTPWTWCTWMGPDAPPMALGRDADDALAHLRARLIAFFRDEAETPAADPVARAETELLHYRSQGLLCFMAPDEEAAFSTWASIASLTPDEALLRWREVFPCPTRVDPLRRVSACLPTPAERVRRMEADPRYRVLGATASRLPSASERRMTRYKDLASQPTSG